MQEGLETTIRQLQRARRAFGLARDREEAGRRLRRVVAQARRLLNHQPERFPDGHGRHLYMQLRSHVILAEASVHGHAPVA